MDMPVFATAAPSYAEVLEARAGRVAMVRDFLATVTSDVLAAPRKNPWTTRTRETTLSCLHVILGRSGNTTATPYATSTRLMRCPTHEPVISAAQRANRGIVSGFVCRSET